MRKWGFWGGADTTSSTQARLPRPCLLASPKNLQQQRGGLQSSLKIGIKLYVLGHTLSIQWFVYVVLPGVSLQHKPDASYPFFTVFGCSPRCGTLTLGGTWAPVEQNLETQGPCALVLKVPSCASSLMLAQLVLATFITASIAIAAPADRKQT